MNSNDKATATLGDAASETTSTGFQGFESLESNYVYCPNQFFDICLKGNSRGVVRIVAYVLQQSLGWLDENGEPIHQTVKVSYQTLIEKAGVSRGAIGEALRQAVSLGFLNCQVAGSANRPNQEGQAAEYTLRWDNRPDYARTPEDFAGFYAGEGHRTPVPNAFFDQVIPAEPLIISKVVGTVIRHTAGYQTQFGGRRSSAPLSCSYIQKYAKIQRRSALTEAIQCSINAGYIERAEKGAFAASPREQVAAKYSIRWHAKAKQPNHGSKKSPAGEQSKKVTSNSSEKSPAERFKKVTSIEKTITNEINKQQVAADLNSTIKALMEAGFDRSTANSLIDKRGVETVRRQLLWIDARKPRHRVAMLRKAIEQDWKEPEEFQQKRKRELSRQKHAAENELRWQEDKVIELAKQQRVERKARLIAEWRQASLDERSALIAAAAQRQDTDVLRNLILKKSARSEDPSFHVLDELAIARGLPTVSEFGGPGRQATTQSLSTANKSPHIQ